MNTTLVNHVPNPDLLGFYNRIMSTVEEVLSKVLGIEIGSVSDSTSPKDMARWDSFSSLVLINELESNFMVKFTLDEIMGFNRVSDIKKILRQRGINV